MVIKEATDLEETRQYRYVNGAMQLETITRPYRSARFSPKASCYIFFNGLEGEGIDFIYTQHVRNQFGMICERFIANYLSVHIYIHIVKRSNLFQIILLLAVDQRFLQFFLPSFSLLFIFFSYYLNICKWGIYYL